MKLEINSIFGTRALQHILFLSRGGLFGEHWSIWKETIPKIPFWIFLPHWSCVKCCTWVKESPLRGWRASTSPESLSVVSDHMTYFLYSGASSVSNPKIHCRRNTLLNVRLGFNHDLCFLLTTQTLRLLCDRRGAVLLCSKGTAGGVKRKSSVGWTVSFRSGLCSSRRPCLLKYAAPELGHSQ